jgi:hypothetical protein
MPFTLIAIDVSPIAPFYNSIVLIWEWNYSSFQIDSSCVVFFTGTKSIKIPLWFSFCCAYHEQKKLESMSRQRVGLDYQALLKSCNRAKVRQTAKVNSRESSHSSPSFLPHLQWRHSHNKRLQGFRDDDIGQSQFGL